MRRPLASLAVAERLDFLGQAVLFVDGNPLEHLDPLLELLDFGTKLPDALNGMTIASATRA